MNPIIELLAATLLRNIRRVSPKLLNAIKRELENWNAKKKKWRESPTHGAMVLEFVEPTKADSSQ